MGPLPQVAARKRPTCRRKELVAITSIRLQVATFGPFVPSVDEHQTFLTRKLVPGPVNRFGQPVLIVLWCPVQDNGAGLTPPRSIVPRWKDRAKDALFGTVAVGQILFRDILEVRAMSTERVMEGDVHLPVASFHAVRWKLYARVEAELAVVPVAERKRTS